MPPRLGAYVLPGDPVWMRSSLRRYYDLLDDLVVLVPRDGTGWTGRRIPVESCLKIIDAVDRRRIARYHYGQWTDREQPMKADTSQRQAGVDLLSDTVDWIVQLDNDEVLPDPAALVGLLTLPVTEGVVGVEWPMRVLLRRLRDGRFLEVAGPRGQPVFEYPGPVLVRAGARLVDARRHEGGVLRMVVEGDRYSLQNRQPLRDGERRQEGLSPDLAIVHNSWGRSPASIWRKTRTWGHAAGTNGLSYFFGTWLPLPLTWRVRRNLHPFADALWPAVRRTVVPDDLLDEEDRA